MEWFENETLWRELYPYVFPVERVAAAQGQVTRILALAGVSAGAVLDLCCGPGRHAVEFARRGFSGDRRGPLPFPAGTRAGEGGCRGSEGGVGARRHARVSAARGVRPGVQSVYLVRIFCARRGQPAGSAQRPARACATAERSSWTWWAKSTCNSQGMKARRTQFADGAVLIQQPHVREDWTRLESEWTVVQARPVAELPVRAPPLFGTGLAGPSAELRLRYGAPVWGSAGLALRSRGAAAGGGGIVKRPH